MSKSLKNHHRFLILQTGNFTVINNGLLLTKGSSFKITDAVTDVKKCETINSFWLRCFEVCLENINGLIKG